MQCVGARAISSSKLQNFTDSCALLSAHRRRACLQGVLALISLHYTVLHPFRRGLFVLTPCLAEMVPARRALLSAALAVCARTLADIATIRDTLEVLCVHVLLCTLCRCRGDYDVRSMRFRIRYCTFNHATPPCSPRCDCVTGSEAYWTQLSISALTDRTRVRLHMYRSPRTCRRFIPG